MDSFVSYLSAIAPLPIEAKAALQRVIQTRQLQKGDVLLRQGQVCNRIYFVERGLLRLYYYVNGKEVTEYFATEGRLMGGVDSFFSRMPSRKEIEALEPCVLHSIAFNDLEMLYRQFHALEKAGRLLATAAFLSMQERLFSLQFHPAKQRYETLLAAAPDIVQRVPLGLIASYLGVTQVTLSRIRGQK
jgi:CRP-like cAMP-binding protein